jgi:dihydroorotate dehydrogenase
MLREAHRRVEAQFPLIGVGGIDGPQAALAKLDAGATLVQLYSALVFDGPELITRIKRGLSARHDV